MNLKHIKRSATIVVRDQHSGHKWTFEFDFKKGVGTLQKNDREIRQLDHIAEPISDAYLADQIMAWGDAQPELPQ